MPFSSRGYFYTIIKISFFNSLVIGISLLPITKETNKILGIQRDTRDLNFTELSGKYGYLSEQHEIVTEDGYILTIFRIVSAKNCHQEKKKPPVVLIHGLLQSCDSWIDSGPDAGLAYLIADACHDLWVGNVRGNCYSRAHLRLDPDRDAAYWQFSFDEIAYYDVPALIDYVLNNTNADKLNYVGFSQGAGTFFAMCSERPQYCDKVELMIALAPATRLNHTSSVYLRTLTTSILDLEGFLTTLGKYEVLAKGAATQDTLSFFCQLGSAAETLCAIGLDLINSIEPRHPGSMTNKTIANLFKHFPAGTSVHNMARYGQAVNTNKFVKFDYGRRRNLELYGSASPPEYNLSGVTVPVVTIYGRNDGLVDTQDVKWLVSELPQVVEAFLVEDPLWNHLDVTYSQYTNKNIFTKINEYLNKFSYS